MWFAGIRRSPTAPPPLLGLAAPVTGAVLGWVVLDQSLSMIQLAGFAVTLGAIAYGAVLGGASTSTLYAPHRASCTPSIRKPRLPTRRFIERQLLTARCGRNSAAAPCRPTRIAVGRPMSPAASDSRYFDDPVERADRR